MDNALVSIVVPLYNEEMCILPLYRAISDVVDENRIEMEFICVDDNSSDQTWSLIDALQQKDTRVKGIRLPHKKGQQYALYRGMSAGAGQAVITMDGDGEHPPMLIPTLYRLWKAGNQIVYTKRRYRSKISWFKTASSALFYRFFNLVADTALGSGQSDFRLVDRCVLDSLLARPEAAVFSRAVLTTLEVKKQASVVFESQPRYGGKSKFTLIRTLLLAIRALWVISPLCRFAKKD